jgi:hypothetical protein
MFNLMNISCDYNEDLSQLVNGFIMDELSASILRVQKIQACFVGPSEDSRLFWNISNFTI